MHGRVPFDAIRVLTAHCSDRRVGQKISFGQSKSLSELEKKARLGPHHKAGDTLTNPLHDEGYTSIGCWPCTRATQIGEDDALAAGAVTGKTECGLHTSD